VPGEFSAAILIFSFEPSPVQLRTVTDLHRDFERVNRQALLAANADPHTLIFPQRVLFEG
jgi:hypothetical protein